MGPRKGLSDLSTRNSKHWKMGSRESQQREEGHRSRSTDLIQCEQLSTKLFCGGQVYRPRFWTMVSAKPCWGSIRPGFRIQLTCLSMDDSPGPLNTKQGNSKVHQCLKSAQRQAQQGSPSTAPESQGRRLMSSRSTQALERPCIKSQTKPTNQPTRVHPP